MNVNRSQLPSSITNEKLRALYRAAMKELDLIQAETKKALIYCINDNFGSPIPGAVPELAKDLNVDQLEYWNASLNDLKEDAGCMKRRRDLISGAFILHRKKGTRGVLDDVLKRTGRTDIRIKEWFEVPELKDDYPYAFVVEYPAPVGRIEMPVIAGLIKRYKRAVCQEIANYVLPKQLFGVAAASRWDREIVFDTVDSERPRRLFVAAAVRWDRNIIYETVEEMEV